MRTSSFVLAVAIIGALIGWSAFAAAHPMFGKVTLTGVVVAAATFFLAATIEELRR